MPFGTGEPSSTLSSSKRKCTKSHLKSTAVQSASIPSSTIKHTIPSGTGESATTTLSPTVPSGTHEHAVPSGTSKPTIEKSTTTNSTTSCFPYGNVTLPTDYSAPSISRANWWCAASQQYGFQGFSYPLEDSDCSAASNGFDAMNADFAQMKKDFGATIVRAYYPGCTEASVFENLLKAGVANNMAVIPQVWFGFDNDVSFDSTGDLPAR